MPGQAQEQHYHATIKIRRENILYLWDSVYSLICLDSSGMLLGPTEISAPVDPPRLDRLQRLIFTYLVLLMPYITPTPRA